MRSFFPDCTSTYRSRGTESNFTSPVAGVTRTSIMVSEREEPCPSGPALLSTPSTSTSRGSLEVLWGMSDSSFLFAWSAFGADLSTFWGAGWSCSFGSRSREAMGAWDVTSTVAWVLSVDKGLGFFDTLDDVWKEACSTLGGFFSATASLPAFSWPTGSFCTRAADCVPIAKNKTPRMATTTSLLLRYRARLRL